MGVGHVKRVRRLTRHSDREPPPLLYFCREQRRGNRDWFNFPPALPGPAMHCTRVWTRALLVLAASMILLSHPHWLQVLGRRRAAGLARELARPFADQFLIPHADRNWIISSATVREFASEAMGSKA